jgi:hypothetical protein
LAALALAACAPTRPAPLRDWESYAGPLVPGPLLPIEAAGSVQFNYRGNAESGQVLVQGNRGQDFRMRVSARLLGTAALELRFSGNELLVMDFGTETYYRGANDPETRRKLFAIDMSLEDFQMLLTARIPRSRFEAGGGRAEAGYLAFEEAGARYRFELDAQGLPIRWSRVQDGIPTYRVEYRDYQDVPAGAGVLRFPRRARVYTDGEKPALVLGVSEYRLGSDVDGAAPLALDPPPGLRFQPLDERPDLRD